MEYRNAEQEKILKEIEEMDEAAQAKLYSPLNHTIDGKSLAEQDPVILRVTQQTLKERLELENLPVVEDSLYSRIKEKMPSPAKVVGYTGLVTMIGAIVLSFPPLRKLYDQDYRNEILEEQKSEEQMVHAQKKLEEMIDRNCTGELSAGEFLGFYKAATGKEFRNKPIEATILANAGSYLRIVLKKEVEQIQLSLDEYNSLPRLTVTLSPETALQYVSMVQEKEGSPCSLELR